MTLIQQVPQWLIWIGSYFIFSTLLHNFFFVFEITNRQSLENYPYGQNLTLRPDCLHTDITHILVNTVKKDQFCPYFGFLNLLHTFFYIFEITNRQSLKSYAYGANLTLRPDYLHKKVMGIKRYVLKKGSISAPELPFFLLRLHFFGIKISDSWRA